MNQRLSNTLFLLPDHLQQVILQYDAQQQNMAEEIRLRIGQRMSLLLANKEVLLDSQKICRQDLQVVLDRATEFSAYRCAESIRNGYITVQGGCRIGLCGTAILRDGKIATLQDVSSIAIRLAKEICGVADELYPQLWRDSIFENTLLIAPPGGGKTTLLRDLIRCLSNGDEAHRALRMAVVDERCEIAAMHHGEPQFYLGRQTDVLSGAAKAEGISMVLRSMNPEVIAVDEITTPEDIRVMEMACNCGVSFLATVHGQDLQEIRNRKICRTLLESDIFHQFVILERQGGKRYFRVERC